MWQGTLLIALVFGASMLTDFPKSSYLNKDNIFDENYNIDSKYRWNQNITDDKEWMDKNLDVSTFRNGDPIYEASTDEEWKNAYKNSEPAWCYYEKENGKLYNCYAVNDQRGLAPEGWHIPNKKEWKENISYSGITGKEFCTRFNSGEFGHYFTCYWTSNSCEGISYLPIENFNPYIKFIDLEYGYGAYVRCIRD